MQLFATPWTVARQVPLSMGFSGQEYWSGWPFPIPEGLPHPGIETASPALAGRSLPLGSLPVYPLLPAHHSLCEFVPVFVRVCS